MRVHSHIKSTTLLYLIIVLLFSACAPFSSKPGAELVIHQHAMLPQAQGQLEQFGLVPQYEIGLHIDDEKLLATGHENVLYTNNQSEGLNELYFRLYANLPVYDGDLQITMVTVNGKEVQTAYEAERTALHVPLSFTLKPGRRAEIDIDFQLKVKQHDSEPALLGESLGILSLPSFYPMIAIYRNGQWDLSIGPEFADAILSEMALYNVTVDVPPGMVVVSTGSVIAEENTPEGRRMIQYVSGPARDFGLIMSRLFERQSLTIRGIEINSYSLPEDTPAGYSALWRAAAAIQIFSDVISDYPYAKLDVVEAPLGKHGMEYPALVFIGSEVYRTEKKKIEPLVVHEIAHQWWYNLVGSDPVNEPAVDEGLAEFSLYYYYERVYGPRRAKEMAQTRWVEPYEYAKEHGLDAVVDQPATAFTPDNYESIVYAKSGVLYNELRRFIGPPDFDKAIRNYFNSYQYRIAPSGAFLGIASGTTPKNLEVHVLKWRQAADPTDEDTTN